MKKSGVVILFLVGMVLTMAVSYQQALAATDWYLLQAGHKLSKCLDLKDGNMTDAGTVQIWQCDKTNQNQMWSVEVTAATQNNPKPDYLIRNRKSNMCLYVKDDKDRTIVTQKACNAGDNRQLWGKGSMPGSSGARFYVNRASKKCLDVQDKGEKNGTPVQQYSCNPDKPEKLGKNQTWIPDKVR